MGYRKNNKPVSGKGLKPLPGTDMSKTQYGSQVEYGQMDDQGSPMYNPDLPIYTQWYFYGSECFDTSMLGCPPFCGDEYGSGSQHHCLCTCTDTTNPTGPPAEFDTCPPFCGDTYQTQQFNLTQIDAPHGDYCATDLGFFNCPPFCGNDYPSCEQACIDFCNEYITSQTGGYMPIGGY